MTTQYNISIVYGKNSGVYTTTDDLKSAYDAMINYTIYYSRIDRPITGMMIEACCANCQGTGNIQEKRIRRYQGSWYKTVMCKDCKGKGDSELIYEWHNMPAWVQDAFK